MIPPVTAIPRTIWILWLQGWDDAPAVVRACLASWVRRNPGWQVCALSSESLPDYLDLEALLPARVRWTIEPEALADVARIGLLRQHGGVYVDSTVYCNQPLDDWLTPQASSGFFAFDRSVPIRPVAKWFIAAASDDLIVRFWHDLTLNYWSTRTARDDDFWFDQLFVRLYETRPEFRAHWDEVPKWPAAEPEAFTPARLRRPLSADDQRALDGGHLPVLKLTHKIDPVTVTDDSLLAYLEQRSTERASFWDRTRRAMERARGRIG